MEAQATANVSMVCPYTRSAVLKAFQRHFPTWVAEEMQNPTAVLSHEAEDDDQEEAPPAPAFSFGGRSAIHADADSDAESESEGEAEGEVDEAAAAAWASHMAACAFQWSDYEQIEWENVLSNELVASSYCVRKGLIRKAQLAFNVQKFLTKAPSDFLLHRGFPKSFPITIYHQDYVDEALCELPEVKYMAAGSATWILKPNLTNRGTGIELFDSCERFVEIVEAEENAEIREWVVQQYIERPLLVDGRKFHLRAYVVAVGAIQVFFFSDVLALFSLTDYPQSFGQEKDLANYAAHLTNTCFQHRAAREGEDGSESGFDETRAVRLLSELGGEMPGGEAAVAYIMRSMEKLTAETFQACAGEIGFFPVPNCFEMFGLDFLVECKRPQEEMAEWVGKSMTPEQLEENFQVYILELNAEPDFVQTGDRLRGIVEDLMDASTRMLLGHFFPETVPEEVKSLPNNKLKLVYDKEESPYMAGGSKMTFG